MGRAVGPQFNFDHPFLGRCPRLVWFEPLALKFKIIHPKQHPSNNPGTATMPQSLSLVIVQVVFSTKERRPFLDLDIRPKLHAYLATVARNAGCESFRVGGVADHVHLAIRMSRTITIADLIETLKTSSSKWVKTQSDSLSAFAWQRGYGCFSVGPSDLDESRRTHQIYRRARNSSRPPLVPGRIPHVLQKVRRRMRRGVCVGLTDRMAEVLRSYHLVLESNDGRFLWFGSCQDRRS